jgi:hypothetical protein
MDLQTLLDGVFNTWERDHHALFARCLEVCTAGDPALYWSCAVKCHDYFNQQRPYEVEEA